MTSQRFCLRWNNHQSNLLSVFDQLLHDESFVDVTLAVEGQLLKAHKMVLSACSPYFQALFVSHPDKHPIVILKDVPFADMRSLLDFMYRGEVSVDQDRLTAFLKVAESLRIKGLTEVNEERPDLPSIASSLLSNSQQTAPSLAAPPPPPNLHRIHLSQPSSTSSSPSNAKRSAPSPSNFSSYAAHGPPDLLEVNMTEHSQNSPSSFSEEQNVGSPEQICTPDISDDCCIKSEPGDDSLTAGTSFQDRKSPQIRDNSSSRSQSQTPTNQSERFPPADIPLLRLVPKSELMATYRKDSPSGAGSSKNDSSESNNNNSSSSNLNNNSNFLLNSTSPHFLANNDVKFSPTPHLLSPQSNANAASSSGDCFTGTPPSKPAPTRRRVRRRATSNSDPAEQLTEMSVRGLNLFRYACIDEGVYKCLECAKTDIVKTFKNKYSFQRHAFLYHEGCQRKVFPCPVCGKEFSRPDKMKNHMKTVHDCFMPKDCMVPKEILFPPPAPIPFFLSPP